MQNAVSHAIPLIKTITALLKPASALSVDAPWLKKNTTYNVRDELISSSDALCNIKSTEYDFAGRVSASVDANERLTEMSYESKGSLPDHSVR